MAGLVWVMMGALAVGEWSGKITISRTSEEIGDLSLVSDTEVGIM